MIFWLSLPAYWEYETLYYCSFFHYQIYVLKWRLKILKIWLTFRHQSLNPTFPFNWTWLLISVVLSFTLTSIYLLEVCKLLIDAKDDVLNWMLLFYCAYQVNNSLKLKFYPLEDFLQLLFTLPQHYQVCFKFELLYY